MESEAKNRVSEVQDYLSKAYNEMHKEAGNHRLFTSEWWKCIECVKAISKCRAIVEKNTSEGNEVKLSGLEKLRRFISRWRKRYVADAK